MSSVCVEYGSKSETFILMSYYESLHAILDCFSPVHFIAALQLSRWLVCGGDALERNGYLTQNPHGTQMEGQPSYLHNISTFQVVGGNVLSILQSLKSNKLTNNVVSSE